MVALLRSRDWDPAIGSIAVATTPSTAATTAAALALAATALALAATAAALALPAAALALTATAAALALATAALATATPRRGLGNRVLGDWHQHRLQRQEVSGRVSGPHRLPRYRRR